MEVVGVVLGGIPLALYALDSYKRCLRMTKDVVKYGATLETFSLHIFIQRKQLELTLRNVGLRFEEGQLPTRRELDTHLARLYPSSHAEFLSILSQMEGIMAKLLDKLDVDSQGKRGLSGSDRDELVQNLHYWNTALSKVFEKAEIPQDEDGPLFANQAPANLTLGLSRKERFAIAAAASWAVLYLCGTPSLREEDWSRSGASAIQFGVDNPPSIRPAVSCDLKAGKAPGKQPDTSSWADADRPSKIRNKILFALGVLLMELSLKKTIDSIQQESGAGSPDIYELAERQTDRVYIDAGHSYGYAVQRCLRCEFPGRDSMKSFDFAQFRRQFFNTVVAPVHAAYIVQRL
ncbi:hypothetical protein B0T26DRAFT_745167 [Lasiosphaeria miniovina]|uniref:DUF7580 domain-containing protein n=1 Tax=Lasiosphaeria miniovina TaxID=1954250 RepID=A0AA40BF63_9PEZI|nr:uncharacterized protein B0T26DRAFT_745167 [Lasiosphaeria miniovina]KAK0733076.1 hypothetical protein B0T26DRAFT_745167 [Lasiosphaeria miniovina]